MTDLRNGLYEALITELLRRRLQDVVAIGSPDTRDLDNAEAADRLALHVARVVEQAINAVSENARADVGSDLARRLVELVSEDPSRAALIDQRPARPGSVLRAIMPLLPDGRPQEIAGPLIPLLDTTLLTNSPGEPRVGHQIATEIASADRIDVVMAFIRRTGIAPLREQLRRHVASGKSLRVLTTTYTGSTEATALEWLDELGAEVRVSYDTTTTRACTAAITRASASGMSRRRLNTLLVASSRASTRLHATP